MSDARRRIPPVDRLLEAPAFEELGRRFSRTRLLEVLRRELEQVRSLANGDLLEIDLGDPEHYARAVAARLQQEETPSLRPVINATGVVLHTNLGRAPLAATAREAMLRAAGGYSNLELDLERGARGSRYVHCAELLRALTGAEDALVVNNNAAALVLALNTLALGLPVLVSRGELVEIGGSFRVPEILERAGARLVEVGSTNRTRLNDYQGALTPDTGAILKVHRSNFRITGFTEEVGLGELAVLARSQGVPLIHDLGSGLLLDPATLAVGDEPTVPESVSQGADVTCFSGDKLLGGPQAGILVGRAPAIQRMRANPLCRALRVDKVTLAGLEATLRLYREPACARAEIPVLAMLSAPAERLEARARELAARLSGLGVPAEAAPAVGVVGGGTCPDVEISSWSVRVRPAEGASALAAALRQGSPPVVGRVEEDRLLLDLRTVSPAEEEALVQAVRSAFGRLEGQGGGG